MEGKSRRCRQRFFLAGTQRLSRTGEGGGGGGHTLTHTLSLKVKLTEKVVSVNMFMEGSPGFCRVF